MEHVWSCTQGIRQTRLFNLNLYKHVKCNPKISRVMDKNVFQIYKKCEVLNRYIVLSYDVINLLLDSIHVYLPDVSYIEE